MKKLFMMLSIFAIMMSLAVVDLWYTDKSYTETHQRLILANESIEANEESLDNPETIRLVDEANDVWEKGKRPLMMLVNHNVIRYMDEKFVSLREQVRGNNKDDATVTVKVLISYLKDLKNENRPYLSNIL